jgi:gas vesicle structural protein
MAERVREPMPLAVATYPGEVAYVPRAGTLYDVLELILDRGMVIDVFARVSLVGIEILKIDVRVVVASVDTYLRFAEVCNRIDLEFDSRSSTVPELFGGRAVKAAGKGKAKKAVKSVSDTVRGAVGGGSDAGRRQAEQQPEEQPESAAEEEAEEQEAEAEEQPRPRRRPAARAATSRRHTREGT